MGCHAERSKSMCVKAFFPHALTTLSMTSFLNRLNTCECMANQLLCNIYQENLIENLAKQKPYKTSKTS